MKIRLSPIIILLGISIIIEVFGSIYYLLINNNGGMALAGTFFFLGLMVSIFLGFIEQSIIKNLKISTNKLWIIESIFIMAFSLYFVLTR